MMRGWARVSLICAEFSGRLICGRWQGLLSDRPRIYQHEKPRHDVGSYRRLDELDDRGLWSLLQVDDWCMGPCVGDSETTVSQAPPSS